ncbi:hypothetical protein Q5762_14495 [Streptomyces sp. P9(2023)]|uniref:hypothetical protein n=1 Tax=unclassified Streptomyces TaxID=2593676 RepID=UPI0028F45212|nr:hypothetical protein [Streptomyces sp. P9(2023)]MDT9689526.1 hypothetical protein [Streptomyces sp. P9(2023)]WSW76506.1 hypothetical protein OG390_28440 [Streptomyces sp. NBC_00996]
MSAFTGTADYYREFRPGFPDEIVMLLDQVAPTGSHRRLLDIGTGPGLVGDGVLAEDNAFTVLTARRPTSREDR